MVVITQRFPESRLVLFAQTQAANPFCALPEVQVRHDQTGWPTVLRGVGPAERTGKSGVTYWPGGTRLAASTCRLLPVNPREMNLLAMITPSPDDGAWHTDTSHTLLRIISQNPFFPATRPLVVDPLPATPEPADPFPCGPADEHRLTLPPFSLRSLWEPAGKRAIALPFP